MVAKRLVVLLVNPTAGNGKGARALPSVLHRLTAAGMHVESLVGRDAPEARRRLADAVEQGATTVLTLGGDGLVNLALQAVAGTPVSLGFLPVGTGNDIARALGVPSRATPRDLAAAVDIVLRGATRRVDAARMSRAHACHWWMGVLASGFDSRVNERANAMSGRIVRGRARYDLAVAAELGRLRTTPYEVIVDGVRHKLEATLVAIGNAPSYGGGMRVAPGARLDDGLLDVTVLGPITRRAFVRVFPRVYSGTFVSHPAVRLLQGVNVTLVSPGAVAYADGERLGALPVTVTAVAGAVRVIAP